jgi:hypothetical protein
VKVAEKPVEKKAKATRDEILALKAEVRKCEDRLAKLNDMRDKLATKAGRSIPLRGYPQRASFRPGTANMPR